MRGRWVPGAVTTRRQRTIAAPCEVVWEIVADPHHQPRWWPGVERVEAVDRVDGGRFTQVMRSRRGRPIRADFTIVELEAPLRVAWEQELAGSPFARVLEYALLRLELTPEPPGTRVEIAHEQTLRGSSRTGGFMLRRATGRRLDEALAGLAEISERSS